jgi:hypothetical protein
MNENIFDQINSWIQDVEYSIVNLVSSIAPWLAPLAPAYMSYSHMQEYLNFPVWVSFSVASVVEMLGLATVSTTLTFWNHNRRYSSHKNRVPITIPILTFLFYLGIVMTVNVLIDAYISGFDVIVLSRALLTLLTVPAAITVSVRNVLKDVQKGLKKPKSERSKNVQESVQIEHFPIQGNQKGWKRATSKSLLDELYVDENLVPSVRELQTRMAEHGVRISVGTAKNALDEWRDERGIV